MEKDYVELIIPITKSMVTELDYLKSEGELVRCKDCKHCYELDEFGYCHCDKDETHEKDWFCADGERNE